jgi:class 3 adenylate cyclase
VEFRVLGPLEVVDAGRAIPLGSGHQRLVLALLVLRAPEPISLDRLIDELWGERPPATAQHAVQVYVSAIRKLLRAGGGEEAVRSSASGYVLEVERERIDARRFERLLDEAQRGLAEDPPRARGLFDEALGLWRGAPLAEFGESEVARREADRLEDLRTLAVEGLVEARLGCGEQGGVIGQLTGLAAANPLRERPRRLLMLALYRSGRHAEALAAYRDACAALDEIGLQPGPELRQLEQAILRHDESLHPQSLREDAAVEITAGTVAPPARRDPAAGQTSVVAAGEPKRPEGSAPHRKVVTALFCDVSGSTALGEELDPEALHGVTNRYFGELRAVIERHGGTVEKFSGDAVMAVFGIPRVHEDDALRAVRAAAEIRERLPVVAEEVGVALTFRTGLNTGVVLSAEAENVAIGDAVNVAARLEQAAAPGEILLGEETLRLVRDAVQVQPLDPLVLKGKSMRAFRLVSVDPLAPGLARHLEAPLVGRDRELRQLQAAWDRTVQEAGCHLFTLLGAAGVGKSRLVAELIATIRDDAIVLQGRCLHYGEGITFWPLLEALRTVVTSAEPVIERLVRGGAATPEELFFEVRRLLEALAQDRPMILHVDDLQWAEAMLLDLLDHIVELSRGAPILLLCSARPELLEDRSAWGGGKLNATTVLLEPLAAADCALLLDLRGHGLAPEARARVIAASEGNPLFLEEMTALTRECGTVAIPPTIQALLAARLESLPRAERELLERGAIEGEVFHRLPLHALAGDRTAAGLERAITGLVRKELIRPHAATLHGDDAFRFRHLLIRDAAYDSLPKATRSQLHERFAGWLEDNARELPELDEIAGWHLEQADRLERELGREPDRTLANRAAEHLHAAGRRASERGDLAAATNLLERALVLAPEDSTLKAATAADLAERLIDLGDLARVGELLAMAESDPNTAALAALTRFEWMIHAEPQGATAVIQAGLPRILERLAKAGDDRGLAKAHMVAFWVHWLATQATAAGEELRRVAEHARRAGDGGMRSRALAQYVLTLIYGPANAATMAREIAEIEEEDLGPYLAAFVHLGHSELKRLEGNLDEARRLAQRGIDDLGSLGMGAVQAGLEQDLGQIELSAGDTAAALAALLRSDAILAQVGERALRSTTQALIALAHARLGDTDAADAAIELAEQLSAAEDILNYALTHEARALLALAESDSAAAESWAKSSVQCWSRTDFIRQPAQARLDLARVLMAIGREDDAIAEASEALELYDAKGDRPGGRNARAFLDELKHRT